MSNFVPERSRAVKFVLKCIATLDEYEVEELAHEISPDDADQLAIQILEEACATREAWAGARSLRRSRRKTAAIARLIRILESSTIFLIVMIPIS